MVTHKSAIFTFSTYLHFMTKDLLALIHIIQLSRPPRHQSMQCSSHHYHTRWVCDSHKSVVCAIGIVMVGTGFRSRSTNMKPQKAGFPKLRYRHGSTSPSLANMHPNSGHRVRSQRQGAKKESKWPSWQKNQKNGIMKLQRRACQELI